MTLRDYLNILRERKMLIVATIAVVTASALFFSFRQVPEYSTTARLRVRPVGAGSEVAQVLQTLINTQTSVLTEAELVRSTDVAKRVVDKLKLPITPEELLEQVQVEAIPATEVLTVTARALDPSLAKALADGFSLEYIETRRSKAITEATALAKNVQERLQRAQGRLRQLDQRLRLLDQFSSEFAILSRDRDGQVAEIAVAQSQLQGLLDRSGLKNGAGELIMPAPFPDGQSSPNHVRNGILGVLVALPLAVGLTLLRDSLSDTIKSKEEAEHLTGASTLGLIPTDEDWAAPAMPWLASREEPSSAVSEAYRQLRVNLEYANNGNPARYVVVTSPGRGEGKSATSANLGYCYSEAGRRTVLVSADLRKPRLHEFIGANREPGLSEALDDPSALAACSDPVGPNLWFVPSGAVDATPEFRMGRKEMESMFGRIAGGPARAATRRRAAADAPAPKRTRTQTKGADVVLFDMPPILRASEVSAIAPAADGVLLVVHVGLTRRVAATRAAEQIRKVGGRILGVVLVGVRPEEGYGVDELSERRGAGVNRAWEKVVDGLRR